MYIKLIFFTKLLKIKFYKKVYSCWFIFQAVKSKIVCRLGFNLFLCDKKSFYKQKKYFTLVKTKEKKRP